MKRCAFRMTCRILVLAVIALFLLRPEMQSFAGGDDGVPQSPVSFNENTMNGFTLRQFSGFWKKWHYVTTRYRKDTGEMRFIYANDIAWEALLKKSTDYPAGAIFGKIGFVTGDDPDFTSSVVPRNIARYQFMVRDKEKFKETSGWGYAIFLGNGHTAPEDPAIQSAACDACHALVAKDRGSVFGQPLEMDRQAASVSSAMPSSPLVFVTKRTSSLRENIKRLLPPSYEEIRLLTGPLQEHLFSGTIDEIKPALIKEAISQRMPAALISPDNSLYSIAFISPGNPECVTPGGRKGHAMTVVYKRKGDSLSAAPAQEDPNAPTSILPYCEAAPLKSSP